MKNYSFPVTYAYRGQHCQSNNQLLKELVCRRGLGMAPSAQSKISLGSEITPVFAEEAAPSRE